VDIDGVEVLPKGSILKGVVTTADPAGKTSGNASLMMRFRSISVPGLDDSSTISASVGHTAESTQSTDAKKIGIPAVGGAILGAIIGGKKGAGIGAVIGGGAGAVVVLTSSGPEVQYQKGVGVSLSLDHDVQVRVPLRPAVQ
jgi:hypothetical protein